MTMYLVIRDNQVKMSIPDLTIKADGTIWMRGMPLLGIADPIIKAKASDACKRQAWGEISAEAYTHIGVNANGLTVITQSDYMAAQEAKITPAQKMRREINHLFDQAGRLENSASEDNVSGPIMLRSKARKMLEDWRKTYPTEAAQEHKQSLLDKASALRDKASGALVYDCDGSLSSADQQARHDDFINKAKALEAEAAKIGG